MKNDSITFPLCRIVCLYARPILLVGPRIASCDFCPTTVFTLLAQAQAAVWPHVSDSVSTYLLDHVSTRTSSTVITTRRVRYHLRYFLDQRPSYPTYLIQKDDSYTAYIARDDFYNTSPPTRSLFELSIPRRLHIDSVQSKTTHAKENYYIYDRPFPTVCKPRLFSLSYVLSSQHGEEKTKVPFLDVGKIRYEEDGRERRSIDSVQRRRRVRTAQSEPEEFRRLDISSDDHPARSGRPINRQDLAGGDRPWEKFASPHASSRSIDFIVGARRCIWCGKISRYSPHLLFPFLYLLSIDGSNFNRFSFSRNHLYYRHFGTVYRWMYENFYFAIKIRDPLIVTREQIYVLDWFCFVEQWDERDWRIIKPSADKRYSWEKQWGDILFRSIANRFWTDIKIYGSSLFHSDFAPSSHQLETSFYFPGCNKEDCLWNGRLLEESTQNSVEEY